MENLLELVAQMREYEKESDEPSLAGFLERVALVSDVDGYDPDKGAVSLMTVHTAKGLEFPTVYITGMEERIFPHARSVEAGDDSAIEEERRLCYVAVTRARKKLHLSRARRRRLGGQELPGVPSRFLRELPADAVEAIVTERPGGYGDDSAEGQGPWGGGSWSRPRADPWPTPRGGSARGPAASRAAPAARPGDLVVDYEAGAGHDAGEGGLVVGMKLRHKQMGIGEVRAWQGTGPNMKITLRFPDVGVKTILARFLDRP